MRFYKRKYDYTAQRNAIDDFVVSGSKESYERILLFLRDGSIRLDEIPKAKQTKELLLTYLDMPEITRVRPKWISKKLLDDEVWKKVAPKCIDYEDIPTEYLTEKHFNEIVRSDFYSSYTSSMLSQLRVLRPFRRSGCAAFAAS